MRQYWLPVLFSRELDPDGPPERVRLLGEDLVAFRDSGGHVGLLGQHCPHRGASLFFGRNEEDGIRCVYHGWKFDAAGNCLDMPNEPPESNFKHKIRHAAYPTIEAGGMVWAYMGAREMPPPFPHFEWTLVPEDQRRLHRKAIRECNWLQALEGDLDTSHVYFLHARLHAEDSPNLGFFHEDRSPRLEVVETDCGVMYGALRTEEGDRYYCRTTQFLTPVTVLFPGSEDGIVPGHMWVPMDDEHTITWAFEWHPYRPLTPADRGFPGGVGDYLPPGGGRPDARWWTVANRSNDYLLDRATQRTTTFTGIPTVPLQDTAVTESMGSILDRTREHLGTTDAMIIRVRRRLLAAARALRDRGKLPPEVDDPERFRVRSCSVILPAEVSWVEALSDWHHGRAGLPEARAEARRWYVEREARASF